MYSSSGKPYVREALLSARSSLRHNPLPHVLFASPAPAKALPGLSIQSFEASGNPYIDKIVNMRNSPFERTIFLDSDTFVVDEIAHVLRVLDRYDIAVAHAPGYRGALDPDVPTAFYEFNTGVMAWRTNERVAAFMASWQETYVDWMDKEPFHGAGWETGLADQPAFRNCAWTHSVRLVVLGPEYNFRLSFPMTVVKRVRVIHGRHRNYEAIAARVNQNERPRTFSPATFR